MMQYNGSRMCHLADFGIECLVLEVWCNTQVLDLLVRAGVDLVRRRRGLDRRHPTEPSPSMHQNFPLPVLAE